ncbi:MAG: hypothetical protein JNK30_21110 [Phenylobacterium sp.]|uniref:hypothetical protein n=1 Tax=Phenylobacterium sp. TaxID=1871053 RepID=UPI001A62E994|nr:hypothetical protein [Phenylobacterium sp.]MBL8773900.1 hypothetical protein [Phenylobacterium sp.]
MSLNIFLDRCERYLARRARPMSRARLSTILFGSGATLDRLRSGKTVTVRVLSRAEDRLRDLERIEFETEAA